MKNRSSLFQILLTSALIGGIIEYIKITDESENRLFLNEYRLITFAQKKIMNVR